MGSSHVSGPGKTGYPQANKMILDSYLIITKLNSKYIKNISIRANPIKLLQEYAGESFRTLYLIIIS